MAHLTALLCKPAIATILVAAGRQIEHQEQHVYQQKILSRLHVCAIANHQAVSLAQRPFQIGKCEVIILLRVSWSRHLTPLD
jgi:hypothetical protein